MKMNVPHAVPVHKSLTLFVKPDPCISIFWSRRDRWRGVFYPKGGLLNYCEYLDPVGGLHNRNFDSRGNCRVRFSRRLQNQFDWLRLNGRSIFKASDKNDKADLLWRSLLAKGEVRFKIFLPLFKAPGALLLGNYSASGRSSLYTPGKVGNKCSACQADE